MLVRCFIIVEWVWASHTLCWFISWHANHELSTVSQGSYYMATHAQTKLHTQIMGWISVFYELSWSMALTWSNFMEPPCLPSVRAAVTFVCHGPYIVGIAYNKPDVSCHACFNFHLHFSLTVVLHCRSWLSSSTSHEYAIFVKHTCQLKFTVSGRKQASKQSSIHTCTWCCLTSVGWLIDLCIIERSNSSLL